MAEIVLTTLKISVVALIFAIGLGSRTVDLAHLFDRPRLFLRSLVAMYVLVPLAALALVFLLPLGPAAKTALLVLAASAGAPLLPKKLAKIGNEAYVLSLVVFSSIFAIVAVPVWIAIYAQIFQVDLEFSYADVARILGKGFLIPLAVGMVLGIFLQRHRERIAGWILAVSGIGLAAAGLALVVSQIHLLKQVPFSGYAGLILLLLVALAIGHWLGGPDPRDRSALAVTCATRHLGVVILIAASLSRAHVGVIVVTYLITSLVVTIPYMKWRERVGEAESAT
jgi:BASS family bile acid:Na+ symporter